MELIMIDSQNSNETSVQQRRLAPREHIINEKGEDYYLRMDDEFKDATREEFDDFINGLLTEPEKYLYDDQDGEVSIRGLPLG